MKRNSEFNAKLIRGILADVDACQALARKAGRSLRMPIAERVRLDRAAQAASLDDSTEPRCEAARSELHLATELRDEARAKDLQAAEAAQEQAKRVSSGKQPLQKLHQRSESARRASERLRGRATKLEAQAMSRGAGPDPAIEFDPCPGSLLFRHAQQLRGLAGWRMVEPPFNSEHANVRALAAADSLTSGKVHPLELLLRCPLGGCNACTEPVRDLLTRVLDQLSPRSTSDLGVTVACRDAAKMLGVHPSTISRMVRRNDLDARFGSDGRVEAIGERSIQRFLAKRDQSEEAESDRQEELFLDSHNC